MDLDKAFHMKGGIGETSYANNSILQKKASDKVKHITLEAIQKTFAETKPESIGIADMGCSSGLNTLSTIKELVDAVIEEASRDTGQPEPEIRVYLNDLPTNDFNTVFQGLPEFYRNLRGERNRSSGPAIYVAGCPGTFYGRVLPQKCLHFVYSSHSLHWLSKVPRGIYDEHNQSINKKSIYISERSPTVISEMYYKQFQEDFSSFLKSRSQELISRGRMVLILSGRNSPLHVDRGISFLWEILYQSLATLVDQGEIEKEKLENYEVNFYAPTKEELEDEVKKEGSFTIELVEKFEVENDSGVEIAKAVRSIQEPRIAHHFGEGILDNLFQLYGRMVDQEIAIKDIDSIILLLVLAKV